MDQSDCLYCSGYVDGTIICIGAKYYRKGQVLDAKSKEPLIGVSVLEKGTTNGTITDFDGNYVLNVAKGRILVFSYVGYTTQEIAVNQPSLTVSLKEDTQTLNEVVVVGYGVQKKSSVTGSISQVKAEDMETVRLLPYSPLYKVRLRVYRSFLHLQLREKLLLSVYVVFLLT